MLSHRLGTEGRWEEKQIACLTSLIGKRCDKKTQNFIGLSSRMRVSSKPFLFYFPINLPFKVVILLQAKFKTRNGGVNTDKNNFEELHSG